MTVTGIVAEFNPFHRGHAHLIHEARRITGCDYVVVVMSGNFVQDGTPALTDKYVRTKMCLVEKDGADMVFEIPSAYATASAEGFAKAAITLLHNLGFVDYVCFGSESCHISLMNRLADLYLTQPETYRASLQSELKQGKSYPKARQAATVAYFNNRPVEENTSQKEIISLLEAPNALLGLEYCRAIRKLQSDMVPIAIPRHMTDHHDLMAKEQFASATTIRQGLLQIPSDNTVLDFCPPNAKIILQQGLQEYAPVSSECLVPHFQKSLLDISFQECPSDCTDLYRTIHKEALSCHEDCYEAFICHFKHKGITQTHVQRFFLHLLWKERWQKNTPPDYPVYYLRLLGFRKDQTEPLRKALRQARLPVITKVADYAQTLSALTQSQQFLATKQFQLDLYASQFYYLLQGSDRNEYTCGVVIV